MAQTIQERLAAITPATDRMETVKTIGLFLAELEKGAIRSALRDEDGVWRAQTWVKEGILLAFRTGVATESFAPGRRRCTTRCGARFIAGPPIARSKFRTAPSSSPARVP